MTRTNASRDDVSAGTAEQFAYVPVTETSIQLGLYVTGVGYSHVQPGQSYPDPGHPELYDFTWRSGRVLPEFQFVYIHKGQGEFETKKTGRRKVHPGTMLLLSPDEWHRYRPDADTGWTEYWISVNGDLIYDWQRRGLITASGPLIRLRSASVLVSQYTHILRLLKKHPRHQPASAASRAMLIISTVIDQASGSIDAEDDSAGDQFSLLVRNAIREIWSHGHQQMTVGALARRLNVCRRRLERAFVKEVGHGVHREITQCRLQRARRLLEETQVPVKAIAFVAGFASVTHLSRAFQRTTGLTPGQYRESVQAAGSRKVRRRTMREVDHPGARRT